MRLALAFLTIAFAGCAVQPAPATTTATTYSEPAPEPAAEPVSSCNDACYQDCMDEGVLDYGASEDEADQVCAPECGCEPF